MMDLSTRRQHWMLPKRADVYSVGLSYDYDVVTGKRHAGCRARDNHKAAVAAGIEAMNAEETA